MIKGEAISKNAKDYTAEAQKIVDDIKAENEKAAGGDEEALKKINELKAILDGVAEEEKAGKFAELAKEHSACPSSSKGGDLGEFTHGQMVKEFDEVAFSLPVGQISDPVKTQFGYHLVMTTGKTEATEATDDKPAAPEKVRASHILVKVPQTREVPDIDTVVAGLKRNDERKIVNDYVMSLVRAAKIEAADDFKQLLPPPEEPETVPVDSAE
ncbi:MAG: peptidyl-prolyl cis-trans isomerase [Kiritimatiellae bacterium]|nr:peptidyl-prolyl cis-trans isomerase [Kiritimatiellia bacterium]